MYKFGERSLKSLQGIHPNLVKVMQEAIKTSPIDFTITDGVRTLEQQKALYAQGRTKLGPIVTYADGVKNKSNHQVKADGYGHAIDLYPFFLGQIQLNHKDTIKNLRIIADHIQKVANQLGIKITRGIDWKKPFDAPHYELA